MTNASFDELNVKRINVVDDNGKLRLTLSNATHMPDPVVEGQELTGLRQVDPDTAGLIFFNAEGDECGGLVFQGRMTPEGPQASGFLSFDQFRQNEAMTFSFGQRGSQRGAGFNVWDRPETSVLELVAKRDEIEERAKQIEAMDNGPEKDEAARALQEEIGHRRLFVGRGPDGEVAVKMADSKGRERIRLRIDSGDVPRLEFLDEDGTIVYSLPPQR